MRKIQPHSDEDLILQLQSGVSSAMAPLVKKWHKSFCDKAYWMVKDKDAAKDIAQDSWAIILNRIDSLKDPKRFKYWALRIVINKSTDWLRLQTKKHRRSIGHDSEIADVTLEDTGQTKLKKALLHAIHRLPNDQKVVIRLFYMESYSLKAISGLLQISEGTVKSRLFYAREKLKKTLKHINYEN